MNKNESVYLDILKKIIKSGNSELKENRTGINTLSIFGILSKYDLRENFPLLTTKKMYWKGIVAELLWFLRGDHDLSYLHKYNVHIWDKNAKNYSNKKNIKYGELGPIYGFQWRNFNNQSVDQLSDLISQIKNNPNSRRHILSAWNPAQIEDMALPPCHIMCHFNVTNNKEIDCLMYQRSADMFLGVPFNIASYSLLTFIIGYLCDLIPRYFIHTIGDCHIYENHIRQVKEQIMRVPLSGPSLIMDINKNTFLDDIQTEKVNFNNFKLEKYNHYDAIKAEMAV